ncbi:ATP-binding protein [Streptomyces sp. URMC 123]|uniref:ATP-binding protein n=1 Tax=Streptomyces sp. URMC 123 TaxID=3423403 RepID=UPI003F1D7FED
MAFQRMERGRGGGGALADALEASRTDVEQEPDIRRRLRHGDLTAVAEIRAALRELMRHRAWGGPDHRAVAELLASELVTNALVHTDRGAEVTATVLPGRVGRTEDRLLVEVRDFASRGPAPRTPDGEGTHGRGLVLVQSLADAWGARPHGTGKVVWFELDGGLA